MDCGCCRPSIGETEEVFKPGRKRWCTDIACCILFFAVGATTLAIGAASIINGDWRSVIYPQDYSGQFCGSTPAVRNRPYAWFPQLDEDINMALATGVLNPVNPLGFATFRPYTLCMPACPPAFSLVNSRKYGGDNYPAATGTEKPKAYWPKMGTKRTAHFCLPSHGTLAGGERQMCGSPVCSSAAAQGVGAVCELTPNQKATDTMKAWAVTTQAQRDVCEFLVDEKTTIAFEPPGYDAGTNYWELQFASHVDSIYGIIEAIVDARTQVIVMGIAAPFGLGFVWFVLLFLFAGFFVYFCLVLLLLLLAGSCFYLYAKAGLFDMTTFGLSAEAMANATAGLPVGIQEYTSANAALSFFGPASDSGTRMLYTIAGILATIGLVIYIIVVILLRKNVKRCVAILRESASIFRSVPFVVFWPLVGNFFCVLVLVYGVVVSSFIVTQSGVTWAQFNATLTPVVDDVAAGTGTTGVQDALNTLNALDPSVQQGLFLLIHAVGVIWSIFFIQACTYTTYASVPADWFFNPGKAFGFGVRPVVMGAWRVITKHMGTMAFGSFLLTLLTIIRMALEYVMRRKAVKGLLENNFLLKLIFCCLICCLKCFECCLKYIMHHAYIFVAIRGNGFVWSCVFTFGLIGNSGGQLLINNMVGTIVGLIITITIPSACGILTFYWLDNNTEISPTWPSVLTFVSGLVIANGIAEVFRCVIDTIFCCAYLDIHQAQKYPSYTPKMSDRLHQTFFGTAKLSVDSKNVPDSPVKGAPPKPSAQAQPDTGDALQSV